MIFHMISKKQHKTLKNIENYHELWLFMEVLENFLGKVVMTRYPKLRIKGTWRRLVTHP